MNNIAPSRFELLSAGPEPAMLGRYTTGLTTGLLITIRYYLL